MIASAYQGRTAYRYAQSTTLVDIGWAKEARVCHFSQWRCLCEHDRCEESAVPGNELVPPWNPTCGGNIHLGNPPVQSLNIRCTDMTCINMGGVGILLGFPQGRLPIQFPFLPWRMPCTFEPHPRVPHYGRTILSEQVPT